VSFPALRGIASLPRIGFAAAALLGAACGGPPKPAQVVPSAANTHLIDAQGRETGTAAVLQSKSGGLLVLKLWSIPPGVHGLHLHTTGMCDPPGFLSADAHYNPGKRQHGTKNPQGTHAGDLPNVVARADSTVDTTLAIPMDLVHAIGRGAAAKALVAHAGADDLRTDPSGSSGPRIACGVLQR
jgi:Cu-Zn family superoxide dismutase